MNKELRKLVKALEQQGFTAKRTSRGHIFITKDGQPITTIAGTASDRRSLRNAISQLRRAGFNPDK